MNTNRVSMILGVLAAGFFAMACDKPGEDAQKKRDEAQQELTQAQVEAHKKVDEAKASADQKLQKADADFQKSVVDYRTSKQKDLADLDKSIADLTVKQQSATGKAKADLDAALPNIRTMRDNTVRALRAVDEATPMSFDATKTNVDKAFDDLKAALKTAS